MMKFKSYLLGIVLISVSYNSYGQDSLKIQKIIPVDLLFIEEYKTKPYALAFSDNFKTKDDLENFQKLRTFLNERKSLWEGLVSLYHESQYEIEKLKRYHKEKDRLEKEVSEKQPLDTIDNIDIYTPDRYYLSNDINPITSQQVENQILPYLNEFIKNNKDLIDQGKMLRNNIGLVDLDIKKCEQQIDKALAPTYQKQAFRSKVSLNFTLLIALLLVGFFVIIYFKSDKTIGKEFLGDNGLQFITLFVLIIAVILFGILGILEATELAAILSGISGYILGRGANVRRKDVTKDIKNTDGG